jgi:hypothetical protein
MNALARRGTLTSIEDLPDAAEFLARQFSLGGRRGVGRSPVGAQRTGVGGQVCKVVV